MAARYDFLCDQGATFRRQIVWKDDLGAPKSLVGFTARMQIRRHASDPDPTLLSLTGVSGLGLGGAAGTIEIVITATQTDSLPTGVHVYDIEIQRTSDGEVIRLVQGDFQVRTQVTR